MDSDSSGGAIGMGHVVLDMGDDAAEWAGQTVTIRQHLPYAAQQRVNSARTRMIMRDGEVVGEFEPMKYAESLVAEAVVAWDLVGIDGEPLAQGRAGLRSDEAPFALMQAVIDRVSEHYEAQSPKAAAS